MNIRKMAGLFLIVLGLVQYIALFTEYTPAGRAGMPLFIIAMLLLSVGVILFRWKGRRLN